MDEIAHECFHGRGTQPLGLNTTSGFRYLCTWLTVGYIFLSAVLILIINTHASIRGRASIKDLAVIREWEGTSGIKEIDSNHYQSL